MKKAKRIGAVCFYTVLFLCLTAFAVSGFLMRRATESIGEQVIVNDWGEGDPPDLPTPVMEEVPVVPEEPVEIPDEGGATSGAEAPVQVTSGEPEILVQVFAPALPGEVVCAFSPEDLVHSKTFGDWRTHVGVDIAAAIGDEVCAISDGTVSAIIEDPMMGKTVVVEHAGGYASTYSNLETEVPCSVGDKVGIGDVIGCVGDTAVAESADPSHLHLELTLDQEQIDPMSVLSE
ncbi:MAG: M23 family metallopeptidase [Oscillospiraceae bacterium]|nr:M23 family metallopeptidase [Oscillospiraceae bacterium]